MPTEEDWRSQGRKVRKTAGDSWILRALADILDPPEPEPESEDEPQSPDATGG